MMEPKKGAPLEELRRLAWAMEEAKALAALAVATYNLEYVRQKRDAGVAPAADFEPWGDENDAR